MTKRIMRKDLIREIELIKEKTYELKQIVESLPVSSVKTSFEISVTRLEKKIEKFSKVSEKMVLSDEETLLILKIRADKSEAQFRAEKAATETQVHEVSPDVYVREEAKQKKKK